MSLYLETETKISKLYLFSPDPHIEMPWLQISGEHKKKKVLILYTLNITFSIKYSNLRQVSLGYCIFAFTFPWVYILLILNFKCFPLICVNNFINQMCIFPVSNDLISHLYLDWIFYTHNGCQVDGNFWSIFKVIKQCYIP